jgi:hypothetical protein
MLPRVPLVASLVELATGWSSSSPGRRCRRPPEARSHLLGHDLDGLAGAAVLGGPGALLASAHDHDPLLLARDSAACSAWSRHTIMVKNDGSCSRRPDTATE